MPGHDDMTEVLDIGRYLGADDPEIVVLRAQQRGVSLHGHSFYELVYIREGSCLHDAGGRMTLLMAGDLLVIRPGEKHRYIGNHEIKLFNCLFMMSALGDDLTRKLMCLPGIDLMCSPHDEFLHRAHLELPERSEFDSRLSRMHALREKRESGWDIAIVCELALLLIGCAKIFERQLPSSEDSRPYVGYVTHALGYIDAHYAQDLPIAELARQVGVSGDYFTRQFKQVTGITPVEYLRRYRFARAMELLKDGMNVCEVARAVGFQNLCHFSREFKNQLGVTPSQYRKDHLPGDDRGMRD